MSENNFMDLFLFHSLEDLDEGQRSHHPSAQIKIKYASFNWWIMEHEKPKPYFTSMADRDDAHSVRIDSKIKDKKANYIHLEMLLIISRQISLKTWI